MAMRPLCRPHSASASIPLCYKEGMRPDGNCRACMVEIKGERVLAPSCCRYPTTGWKSHRTARARCSQKMVLDCCSPTCRERHTLDSELDRWASGCGRQAAIRSRAISRKRPVAPGNRRQPRLLHPVRALRARLPRGAGQRCHRLRVSRRALQNRLRSGRSDGRLHVRRLRRMRSSLPDRGADARCEGWA